MHAIGIDMSKDSFHVAFNESNVRVFRNTDEGIKDFLTVLQKEGATPTDTTVGTEATGVYHLLLCERLRTAGWRTIVINPILTHRRITRSIRRVKTDRTDALVVRSSVLSGEGYPYTDTPELQLLKTILSERELLVSMRATLKRQGHVRAFKAKAISTIPETFGGTLTALTKDIKAIERQMVRHAPETQALLRTIPGIGVYTAALMVAHIGEIHRFSSPEKLVAYIGLDCRVHESGSSIHGKGYITKRGNTLLRHALFNAAFIARRHNPELKVYFEKKVREGKHYFSALCAVERKLIHLIWAVWTRGTPFIPRT
jgi:transposase